MSQSVRENVSKLKGERIVGTSKRLEKLICKRSVNSHPNTTF